MSTRDIASDLGVTIAMVATITTDTVTNGSAIDTAHFDSGVMFFIDASAWTDGTYALSLEDSPDNSVWTAVPAAKLILPGGAVSISAATSAGDDLGRIGAFSTNQYVRIVVTSTGTTSGATIVGYAIKKGELRPVA